MIGAWRGNEARGPKRGDDGMLLGRIAALVLVVFALAPVSAARAQGAAAPAVPGSPQVVDLSDLVARLLPTVVNISTVRQDAAGAGGMVPARRRSLGSGFVIDPSGLIVTNRHVIERASEITVNFNDGTSLSATVVAAAVVDIAVLRVNPERPLPAVTWGDSFTLRQGTPVIAIGNPLGYSSSVSLGIVSALDRDIRSSPFDDYIQTDAAINQGNSGGPLFNLKGEVIGVNSAIVTTSEQGGSIGLGFAIPSNDAQFVVNRLLQFGRIRVGALPIRVQKPSLAVARAVGLADTNGVIVTGVQEDREALREAIQPGDVILAVDGVPVRDVRTFNRAVGEQIVGSIATLSVWRDGRVAAVKVMVEDHPDDLRQASMMVTGAAPASYVDPPDLGLSLAPVNEEVRTRLRLPASAGGVVVTGVEPFSKAAEQGILAGEVILKVQRDSVSSVRDFWSRVDGARRDRRTKMLLLLRGPEGERWVALPTA
jgi:serine protease Do